MGVVAEDDKGNGDKGSGEMKSASNYDYSKGELPDKEADDKDYILNGTDGNMVTRYLKILARDFSASSTEQKINLIQSMIIVGGTEEPSMMEFEYHPRIKTQTDLYHEFPYSFDKHIIENGYHSQRIIDGANWYELPGSINGTEGMYQIGINQNNVIFHRHFVPFFSY